MANTIALDTMKSISQIHMNGTDYAIKPALDYDDIFQEIAKRFNKVPTTKHQCSNCGGTLEIDTSRAIFKCPYCKTCYAVGTSRINATF